MKLSVLMLVFALSSSFAFAQNEDESKNPDMMNVLEPEFKGINETEGFTEFLQESLSSQYDLVCKSGIEGSVVVQFKILPTGNLSEFLVINSVCPKYDKAVIRALEATNGAWNPGTKNGHPVAMEKEVTFIFKFDGIGMYKTAQMYVVRANKLSKEGKYNKAIKLYNKAIVLCPNHSPTHPPTLYQRGLARYYSGDQMGALQDFERIVELGSHLADPMLAKLQEEAVFARE
jgi:tetratricopeptide (TPR) repeat protein